MKTKVLNQSTQTAAKRDVICSRRPDSWDDFLALHQSTEVPVDLMTETDRQQGEQTRDPFANTAE